MFLEEATLYHYDYVSNLFESTTNPDRSPLGKLLSEQFKSVFTQEDLKNFPSLQQAFPNISHQNFNTDRIAKLLSNVNINKATSPDQIPCWVLKNAAQEIAPFLQRFFLLSLQIENVPQDWRNANIHAILKKGDRSLPSNYRPISLTSVSCKIMDHIIFSHIMAHLEEFRILSDIQHGFRKSHSCETQLLVTLEDLARNIDQGKQATLSCWTLQKHSTPSLISISCLSYVITEYRVP